ncbi:MAG: adenylyl-sulfate kinase [Acidimicrobiia bacterium]|nr:adenylyl-sulfate kinase [Acidimicrobiia bacterium]
MTENVVGHRGEVDRSRRTELLGGGGATILFTGLSGSGKSTIAYAAESAFVESGRPAYVLDGDNLRLGLNSDLGFSDEDRAENVRRVTEVARLMSDAGIITLVPMIAPFASVRERARQVHDAAGVPFFEVFVDTPLEVCEQRDPKGLYRRARAGEIKQMTGIDSPYERPVSPDLQLTTDVDLDSAVEKLARLVG